MWMVRVARRAAAAGHSHSDAHHCRQAASLDGCNQPLQARNRARHWVVNGRAAHGRPGSISRRRSSWVQKEGRRKRRRGRSCAARRREGAKMDTSAR